MARYFLDSSALVKRYHREEGSEAVERLLAVPGERFLVSRLAIVEVTSSFARLVREKSLSADDLAKLVARMEDDVAGGVFAVVAVSSMRLADAATLIATQGLTIPLRTLDAIHLATALAIHGRSRLAGFVAADRKLLAAAEACGLGAIDVSA